MLTTNPIHAIRRAVFGVHGVRSKGIPHLLLAFVIAACGGKSDAQKAAEQACNGIYQLAIVQLAGYYGGEDNIPADELETLDRALQECLRDAENVDSILGI